MCVDYRDLNKASPKDEFPLPKIHILLDNCAKHEVAYFVDCYAGYHQIILDDDDAEITSSHSIGYILLSGYPFWIKKCRGNLYESDDNHVS